MNFDQPLTISVERKDGTPRRMSYELPFARGVYVFVTGHEPSNIVHSIQAIMCGLAPGVINFPKTYDQDGDYTFSVSQGEDTASVSWDGLTHRGLLFRISDDLDMTTAMKGPSPVPPSWERTVLDRAYPSGANVPKLFRDILYQVTSRCVVTLTYPEHGLYPRAVRALARGLRELDEIIIETNLPMLVLVETASAGFLDDLTSPNEPGSLCDRVVFTTYDGLLPLRQMSEAYLSHFRLGDLYYAEDAVVAGKRPDAATTV